MPFIEYRPLDSLPILSDKNNGVEGGVLTVQNVPTPQTLPDFREGLKTVGIIARPGLIESNNFVSGSSGWQLRADGTAEMVGLTITGGTINFGKTSFSDTVNAGYIFTSEGYFIGNAGDTRSIKYTIATGAYEMKGVKITLLAVGSDIDGGYISSVSIQASSIANATITGTKIASGTITATNITAATITSTEIANATITGTDIASGTITGTNITSATITGANIANSTITATQISGSAGITGGQIASGTITGGNISAGTITGGNIDNLTITAANITNLTITSSQIANSTITGGKVATNTITGGGSGNLASSTITAANIVAGTITATEIAASTITASKIAAGTITANEIAASTITAAKMSVSQLSAITADLGNITAGTIVLPSGGYIRSGQTAYNTGIGWYIGNDSGISKLSIGDGTASNSITWNGTILSGAGSIKNLIPLTAGEAIAQYDCVRIHTDGKVYKSSSITLGWSNATIGFALAAISANATGKIQLNEDFTMTGLSAGSIYYVADGTIDRQYSTNNDVSNVYSGATIIAESFTTGGSVVKIDWCEVYGKLIGTGCGNLHFDLYATSGGLPTGAALASTEDLDTSTFSTTDEWHIFRFTTPYTLSSSTKYAIRAVPAAGSVGNNFGWRRGNSSYTGSAWLTNSGSWSEDTTKNMMFRTAYTTGSLSTTAGTITKKIGISLSSTSLFILNS